jgi:PP-loop superfamily ATP-utilizing enzyme
MNPDIKNLAKYQEFYALKKELESFCDKMESIQDIDVDRVSRVTIAEEVYARQYAAQKIRSLLSDLGLIEKGRPKQDKSYE